MVGEIAWTAQADLGAVRSDVFRLGIDRLVVVRRAEPAHGVVGLQAETERIDGDVATHAVRLRGQLRHLLAHRQRGIEPVVHELDGHRGRFEETP